MVVVYHLTPVVPCPASLEVPNVRAPRDWLRNWIQDAIYEEEGWPHDPVNRGIFLGLLYIAFPVIMFGGLILHLTGWINSVPIWMSASLVTYPFIACWIALDEWRSRRRSEDGSGHGWAWQMVQRFWPRRRINQALVVGAIVAHVCGAIIAYADRFTEQDLAAERWLQYAEAVAIVSVDIWLLVLGVAVFRWLGRTGSFWTIFKYVAVVAVVVSALISIGDGPYPWVVLTVLLLVVLALPGWLAHWIWRRRAGCPRISPDAPVLLSPTWW